VLNSVVAPDLGLSSPNLGAKGGLHIGGGQIRPSRRLQQRQDDGRPADFRVSPVVKAMRSDLDGRAGVQARERPSRGRWVPATILSWQTRRPFSDRPDIAFGTAIPVAWAAKTEDVDLVELLRTRHPWVQGTCAGRWTSAGRSSTCSSPGKAISPPSGGSSPRRCWGHPLLGEVVTDRAPALANEIEDLIQDPIHNIDLSEHKRCEAGHG
jgi:hypothetical protein